MLKKVIISFGWILGVGYLILGLYGFLVTYTDYAIVGLVPMLTLPFVYIGTRRPLLGGALLILASLISVWVDYKVYGGMFDTLSFFIKRVTGPIMLLGICFLFLGIRTKKALSK